MSKKRKAKEKDNAKEMAEATCPRCGQTDHLRSTSAQCPYHQPRKKKPKTNEEKEKQGLVLHRDILVYKDSFASVFFKHHDSALGDAIQEQVSQVTKNTFYGTRLLQYHLQRCVEENLPLPNLNDTKTRTWVRQLFTRVFTDAHLETSYGQIQHLLLPLQQGVKSTINTTMSKDYATNLKVFYDTVYDKMHKKWFRHYFRQRGLKDKLCNQLIAFLMDPITKNDAMSLYPKLMTPWINNNTTIQNKIKQMYRLNYYFVSNGLKQYNLCPLYTQQAKYITIDTDTLYYLTLQAKEITTTKLTHQAKESKAEFGQKADVNWKKHVNLPKRYWPVTSELHKKQFNHEIKTDGKGCSISLSKWIYIPKEKSSDEAKLKNRHLQNEKLLQSLPPKEQIRWIGLDPGRVDLASASLESFSRTTITNDTDTKKEMKKLRGASFVLSNKQYYHESSMISNMKWKKNQIQTMNMESYLLSLPSSKTHCSLATRDVYLNYIHHPTFDAYQNYQFESKVKHKRWKTYIDKYRCLDKYCNILKANDPNTVVAYGDASFCHNNGGNPTSLKANKVRFRLEKVHDVKVLMTKEFNSSQVCSSCHYDKKLVGLGSKRDPFNTLNTNHHTPKKLSINKHFVRRCTHCRIIWNRDYNASQNMIFIAKRVVAQQSQFVLFSTRLAKPPLLC